MYETGVVAAAEELAAADVFACDRDELARLVSVSHRLRGWIDAFDARVALRAAQLAADGSCEAPSSVLAGGGRRSTRDAETAARRAGMCADMPALHDALAAGEISAGHVDAVARAAAELDDAGRARLRDLESSLVGSAKSLAVETFERECRDLTRILSRDDGVTRLAQLKQQRRVRRWVDRQTGMCNTLLQLDPEADARVWTAINAALATERAQCQDPDTNWDHLTADAVVNLITGARSSDRRVPEVSVLIDLDTLRHGLHDHSVCETADGQPLPPETIRRLCCDADIIPIVLGGAAEALDVGRQQRLANRVQRRALRAMYRTCAHPGCTVAFEHCRIHHVTWWERLGPTDLANLLPLCSAHHHLVHEGGWTLTIDPDRTLTLRRPDGTISFRGTTVNRTPTAATSQPQAPAQTPSTRPTASTREATPPSDRDPATEPAAPGERRESTSSAPHPAASTVSPSPDAEPPQPVPVDAAPAESADGQLHLVVESGTQVAERGRPPPRAPAA